MPPRISKMENKRKDEIILGNLPKIIHLYDWGGRWKYTKIQKILPVYISAQYISVVLDEYSRKERKKDQIAMVAQPPPKARSLIELGREMSKFTKY